MKTISSSSKRPFRAVLTSRRILMAACILIAAGYLLMSGVGSTAQAFNPGIFSARRIVIAPALCLAGYLLIVVAILLRK